MMHAHERLPESGELQHGSQSTTGVRSTCALARFITGTSYDDIPKPVIHATKRLILDEIVVAAAAFSTPIAQALLKLKTSQGGAPEATLVVSGQKLPAQSAAYVNAQLANLLDADETLLNRMHTVSASAMTGLAMAEKNGASGQDLIAATAIGFDVSARIGLSLTQFMPDGKGGMIFAPLFGWSWMTFGAAATAGRLLRLDESQMACAIGQALVTTPVSFDILKHIKPIWTDGVPANWHRYQMCGAMAAAAIDAAVLASYGWVAQGDIFDEGSEFWRSFGAIGCNWDALYADLGKRWYIAECSIKPYPFCRFGHAALDIVSNIVATQGLAAQDIESVLLRVAPHELSEMLVKLAVVDEGLKLMLSLPTAIALVALGIPSGPKWFNADLRSERVRSIARRVRYEVNDEWGRTLLDQQQGDGFFRRIPTEVIVHTKSGRQHRGFAEYAHGDPWAPGFEMSDDQLADKARRYLDDILPAPKIEALISAVLSLDEARDVGAVTKAMVR
jgi:2-methylcitrate dehydratase PrpD